VHDAQDGVNFELVSWNIRYEVFSFRMYLTHRKIGPGSQGAPTRLIADNAPMYRGWRVT
jgi:hypothetical protein